MLVLNTKENGVVHALMYLFQMHIDEYRNGTAETADLLQCLDDAGFSFKISRQAMRWIQDLNAQTADLILPATATAIRIFSSVEKNLLGLEAIDYIEYLSTIGVLDMQSREVVMDRLLALESKRVDIALVKWVSLMVLFHIKDKNTQTNDSLAVMEYLVLKSDEKGSMH